MNSPMEDKYDLLGNRFNSTADLCTLTSINIYYLDNHILGFQIIRKAEAGSTESGNPIRSYIVVTGCYFLNYANIMPPI